MNFGALFLLVSYNQKGKHWSSKSRVHNFVGDIIQSNNGRIRLTQKTNRKQITWRHNIVFLRQYLPPTLLLLQGYHKFVPRIKPRCWVLQIAIPDNNHRIFQVNISLYLYPQGYISSKGTYRELKCFKKPFTSLETSSTFSNSHQKNSVENSSFEFRSIERFF